MENQPTLEPLSDYEKFTIGVYQLSKDQGISDEDLLDYIEASGYPKKRMKNFDPSNYLYNIVLRGRALVGEPRQPEHRIRGTVPRSKPKPSKENDRSTLATAVINSDLKPKFKDSILELIYRSS